MHKSIKLNYFEHVNILESCKKPGIHNKSRGFFAKKIQGSISIHCEMTKNKCYVSIMIPFENM